MNDATPFHSNLSLLFRDVCICFGVVQVGELYSSCHGEHVHAGRQSLAFHLNARPSAVLSFHDVLEEAGHFVSERSGSTSHTVPLTCAPWAKWCWILSRWSR